MIDKVNQAKRASILIQRLGEKNFYGRLEVRFENGNIVHITQSKNIKIDQVEEEPGGVLGE
jgi:hypothetical protein